mmetsp:Transcript_15060/g.20651  ORF Transcript_15060/g.20651 Transcript_15060/m.20651 type:complete len:207 (-) Transcript_15060:1460-2080(-)
MAMRSELKPVEPSKGSSTSASRALNISVLQLCPLSTKVSGLCDTVAHCCRASLMTGTMAWPLVPMMQCFGTILSFLPFLSNALVYFKHQSNIAASRGSHTRFLMLSFVIVVPIVGLLPFFAVQNLECEMCDICLEFNEIMMSCISDWYSAIMLAIMILSLSAPNIAIGPPEEKSFCGLMIRRQDFLCLLKIAISFIAIHPGMSSCS